MLKYTPYKDLYLLSLHRVLGESVSLVDYLGYIPANITREDTNLPYATSDAVIGNIFSLFDKGDLMINNNYPFHCCKVHLRKTEEYWESDPIRKFENMAQEIYASL